VAAEITYWKLQCWIDSFINEFHCTVLTVPLQTGAAKKWRLEGTAVLVLQRGLSDWLTDCVTVIGWLKADWLCDWLPEWSTMWLADWVIDYVTGWLSDWLTDWLNVWLTECVTDWLCDWLTHCVTGWLTVWLADSLCDWLTDVLCERLNVWLADWHWLIMWLANWLTMWLANWLTIWLAGWLIVLYDWLTDWLCDWLNMWLTVWLADWLNIWMADRLDDWLNVWLADWLCDWMTDTDWPCDWLTDWPCVWLTDYTTWLADCVTDWLTMWLACWLLYCVTDWSRNTPNWESVDRSPTALSHITVAQLVKKFPTSYKKWNFITVFTNGRKVALSTAGLGQSSTQIIFFFQMHYYCIVPSNIRSCVWYLSSRSSRQNPVVFGPPYVPHTLPITSSILSP